MNVNLRRRISRLERILQNHTANTAAAGLRKRADEHDRVTGDDLLRAWEFSDDWLREWVTRDFERLTYSPKATSDLQARWKTLQTGSPEEIFSVLAGLSRNRPGWYSDRTEEALREAIRANPDFRKAKQVREYRTLRAKHKAEGVKPLPEPIRI